MNKKSLIHSCEDFEMKGRMLSEFPDVNKILYGILYGY